MFGSRYFGQRYFGGRYFGHVGQTEGVGEPNGGRYFGYKYFGNEYFAKTYFASKDVDVSWALEQTTGAELTAVTVLLSTEFLAVGDGEAITQSNTVSIGTGELSISMTGGFLITGEEWSVSPPLEFGTLAGIAVVGGGDLLIELSGDDIYIEQTTPVAMEGAITTAVPGGIALALGVSQLEYLSLSAEVAGLTAEFSTVDIPVSESRKSATAGSYRKPRKYSVTIDDEEFFVDSIEEAEALLATAVDAAQDKANRVVEEVVALKGKPRKRALAAAKAELQPPAIESSSALDSLVEAAQAQIKAAYEQAIQTAMLADIERRQIEQDDEDVLMLL